MVRGTFQRENQRKYSNNMMVLAFQSPGPRTMNNRDDSTVEKQNPTISLLSSPRFWMAIFMSPSLPGSSNDQFLWNQRAFAKPSSTSHLESSDDKIFTFNPVASSQQIVGVIPPRRHAGQVGLSEEEKEKG